MNSQRFSLFLCLSSWNYKNSLQTWETKKNTVDLTVIINENHFLLLFVDHQSTMDSRKVENTSRIPLEEIRCSTSQTITHSLIIYRVQSLVSLLAHPDAVSSFKDIFNYCNRSFVFHTIKDIPSNPVIKMSASCYVHPVRIADYSFPSFSIYVCKYPLPLICVIFLFR